VWLFDLGKSLPESLLENVPNIFNGAKVGGVGWKRKFLNPKG